MSVVFRSILLKLISFTMHYTESHQMKTFEMLLSCKERTAMIVMEYVVVHMKNPCELIPKKIELM